MIQDWPTIPGAWVDRVLQDCFPIKVTPTQVESTTPQAETNPSVMWDMVQAGAWLQGLRTNARMSREELAKRCITASVTPKIIYRTERGVRFPDFQELMAMAQALGVEGAPELGLIPLATEGEMKLRQAVRRVARQPKEAIPLLPTAPQASATVPSGPVSRPSILARAAAILGSHRISDSEAQALLDRMVTDYKGIILSDLELPLNARAGSGGYLPPMSEEARPGAKGPISLNDFTRLYGPGMDGDYKVAWTHEADSFVHATLTKLAGFSPGEACFVDIKSAILTVNADVAGTLRDDEAEVPLLVTYRIDKVPNTYRLHLVFYAGDIETLEKA